MVFNVKYQIEILQKLNILFNVPWRIEDNFPKKDSLKETVFRNATAATTKDDTTDLERSRQIDRPDQRSPSKQSIIGVASRKFVGGALRDDTKKGWRQRPGPFGERRKKSLYLQKEKETKL